MGQAPALLARERDADCALILAPRLCAALAEGNPFVPPASETLSLREVLQPWSLALLARAESR